MSPDSVFIWNGHIQHGELFDAIHKLRYHVYIFFGEGKLLGTIASAYEADYATTETVREIVYL